MINFGKKVSKVFCISMQRTGTTSIGKFFLDFGYGPWAGWPADEKNGWSRLWYAGDYETIFASPEFRRARSYEDSPWWLPGFYKVLYHRFPDSKFILFERDPDSWFRSMVGHSNGNAIGDNRLHSKIYRREREFYDLLNSSEPDAEKYDGDRPENWMNIEAHSEHYKDVYRLHNSEVVEFFEKYSASSLFCGQLEDPEKWQKLGRFLGVKVPADYDCHLNSSKQIAGKKR